MTPRTQLQVQIAAGILLAVLALLIFAQNLDPVEFRFWPFITEVRVPKTVLILVSAVAGCVATLAGQWYWRRRG